VARQVGISRRIFLRLGTAFGAGTLLAACAPSAPLTEVPTEQVPTAAAPAEEKVTIRWQDWSDWEPVMDTAMDIFESAMPNVTIEFEPLAEGFEDKTLAMMVAGTAPDVMTGWGEVFIKWAGPDQLLDLQPYVDTTYSQEELADFHQWQWSEMVHPGSGIRFAMPMYVNAVFLFYDVEAFDQAGVAYPTADMDHKDYAEMLVQLMTKEDDKVTRWGGFVPYWFPRMQWHIQAYGGHAVNPDDWTECMLDRPEAQDALEWLRARMWDDNSMMQPLQIEDRGTADLWTARLTATMEEGMGMLGFIAEQTTFEWNLMHVPKGPARRATLGTNDGWAAWKGTEHPDEAWQFLTALVGDEFQMLMGEAWGGIPCRLSLLPGWKGQVQKFYPTLEAVDLDIVLDALEEGYQMVNESFKKQAESEVIIDAALDKVFSVGDTPVSYFVEVAKQVTDLNRAG